MSAFTALEWDAARPWDAYQASVRERRDLWEAHVRRAAPDENAIERVRALPGRRRVLVLTEDWCGDAARIVPVLAALCDASGNVVEHRYLGSDAHAATMDRYLTHGGRAIPMAIVHDEHDAFLGAWGPRPAALQAIVRARRRELGPPTPEQLGEWYAPIMAWYAKDRGRSTVEEFLMLLERGGTPR